MKTKLPLLVIHLSVLILLLGCQTGSPPSTPTSPLRTRATLPGSKDQVWPLLVSEVGLDYPVRALEKDSGLITTDWVKMPAGFNNMNAKRWVVPPGGFLATWNGLRMSMKVMAAETEPGKTTLTVNCHYEAFEDNIQKTWVIANSNGAMESQILEKIEQRLRNAPPPEPSSAPPTTGSKSAADSLIELKKLLDAGLITQSEYEAKRKALIDKL